MTYRRKYDSILKQVIWLKHSSNIYRRFCETWQVLVCHSWFGNKSHRAPFIYFGQSKHKILRIKEAYLTKPQRHRETMRIIRSSDDALFYLNVRLTWIKTDVKTCITKFSLYQLDMVTKAQHMKDLIDVVQNDMYGVYCDFDFKHGCLKQMKEINRHLASVQKYVHRYERSAISPLQFLKDCLRLPQMQLTLHTNQLHEWVT